jgi:hypothetical protein
MTILQLDPPIPLKTPKGEGFAHLVIDYSQEHHLLWVVFLDETGECWAFSNSEVRMVDNPSLGRLIAGSRPPVKGESDPVVT